jgi:hypothetical protein
MKISESWWWKKKMRAGSKKLSTPQPRHGRVYSSEITGVAWQLAGREGAASWKLAEYRV